MSSSLNKCWKASAQVRYMDMNGPSSWGIGGVYCLPGSVPKHQVSNVETVLSKNEIISKLYNQGKKIDLIPMLEDVDIYEILVTERTTQ